MRISQQAQGGSQLSANPLSWLRWWFTPYSTHPEESFRERSIRLFIVLYGSLTAFAIISEIAMGSLPNAVPLYVLNVVTWLALLVVTLVLLLRGKLGWVTALIIVMLLRAAFFNGFNGGYDPSRTSFSLVFLLILFTMTLPARLIIPAGVGALALSFAGTWVSVVTGATPPPPVGMSVVAPGPFVILLGVGIPLTYLRAQLDYHINELLGLVNSLERRVEQRTKELEVALEAAEEANHVKSRFLATMSHELRTPLNAILNFNEMMAIGMVGTVSEEQADLLNKSLQSGNHLLTLINDVLDMSKIQSERLTLFVEEEINLNDILSAVTVVAQSLLEKKPQVALVIDVQPDLPRIHGDKRRIKQVLLNLVSNAIKFTDEGTVTLRAASSGQTVRFAVIDTGAGILPDHQETIFEPFVQTNHGLQHSGSTGLGLPISKSLVELHGGCLWLESTPGEGSAFYVELPLKADAPPAQHP